MYDDTGAGNAEETPAVAMPNALSATAQGLARPTEGVNPLTGGTTLLNPLGVLVAPEGGVNSDDGEIADALEAALVEDSRTEAFFPSAIRFVVEAGVIHLRGTVNNAHAREAAETICQRVRGVQAVQNHIEVSGA